MPYTEFTLWLVPREPLQSTLRSTINQLAASLDAVSFEPHVTVFCGPSTEEEAYAVADRITRQFAPIELNAERLKCTERYTKTLFVQFQESAILRQMFEMAARTYSQQSNYVLDPHLSVLYKKTTEATRQRLCETLDIPMSIYWFDRIRIIETELPIEDVGPVERWRTVCEAELKGL